MKWLTSILGVIAAILVAVAPVLQSLIAGHPAVTAVIAGLSVVLAHLQPSPLK